MEILFGLTIYLAFGFFFGGIHLARCSRCKDSFSGIWYRTGYLMLSALFQIPIIFFYVLISLLETCDDRRDNIG